MPTFTVNGGHSYAIGEETHDSLLAACEAYADRHDSNGTRSINGVLYPCWGDIDHDADAIHDGSRPYSLGEVFAIASLHDVPHIRDHHEPCVGCGARWNGRHLDHDDDCRYIARLENDND